ncbi:MAG: leucine-rich repeat domain-containing protein, partial [Oscillospiraceae bacterium]|nr:leucine-rich repeat domain-containing protein [Oscillospiraceae bacterium]
MKSGLRKVISGILCTAFLASSVPVSEGCIVNALSIDDTALAATEINTVDGVLQYTKYDDHVVITDCDTSAEGEMIIPDTIEGLPVTIIGENAFSFCRSLTAVIIPNSVTSIEYSAFRSCFALKSIIIPNNVTSIGNSAFDDCHNLTSITIPDSVTSIGDWAFCNCSSLTSITIPDSVTSIGNSAFSSCSSLTAIHVDSENQYYMDVDGILFSKNQTVLVKYPVGKTDQSYSIPGSVTIIGDSAFERCSSLISITIPDSVTSIGSWAFYECSALTSITIPDSVISIGDSAFDSCSSLTSVTIPDSVKNIGSYAFCQGSYTSSDPEYHSSDLKRVSIGSGVVSIGENAFEWNSELEEIIVSENNQFYTSSDGILFDKDMSTLIYYPIGKSKKETSYTVPDTTKTIEACAFGMTQLSSVLIPDSVSKIGGLAFWSSTLKKITIMNPDCIMDNYSRYANDYNIGKNAVIYGYPDSTAQAYAEKYNRKFVSLEDTAEQELVIPVDALNMGESVKITLHGQPGQSFNGKFDFSQSDIDSGINEDLNAPAEQLDENGEYEFTLEAPWDMNAFTLHIAYTGEPITYTMQYSSEENQEQNLSIPVRKMSRNTTVSVVLTGKANQAFQPSFDFSEADINMGVEGLVSTKEMTLNENGKFEFRFTAPWAMDPFAFNIAYRGSAITYEITYDIPEEPATTTTSATTTSTTTSTSTSTTTTTSTTTSTSTSTTTTSTTTSTSTSTTTTTSTTTSTSTTTTTSTTPSIPENAELVIPVAALNMGESVTVTLHGQPGQKFNGTFDFSQSDIENGLNEDINAPAEQLDENGEYEFVFEAPWDMNPFSIRVEYSGSPIAYTIDYDRKQENTPVFTEGGDNWSFANSKNYFGETYFINADYKDTLLGKLSNTEEEKMKEKMKKKWNGSCFGMAITSILASNDILIPSEYQDGANFIHDITTPLTEDTLSLINYYYFLQYTDAFQQEITNTRLNTNQKNLETLIECVQDGSPTLLCFYYGVKGNQGHAVVAYGMERAKYSKNGKAYDTKILIYDNVNVDYDADHCLYINTSDYSWTIPHYGTEKYSQSAIALVSDDITFMNQNGYLNGTDPIQKRDYIAIMNSAQVESDFMVSKIDLEEDTWSINSTSDEDDIQLFYSFDAESTESDLMFALMDSKSGYTMQLENPEAQDLSIQYENCLLSADTSHSENIVFDPSGYIEISGSDTKYMLSMTFNEEHYEN